MPPSLDGFGWCTWDAFYSTVSARGLAEGLAALEAGGVSPQLLIIDDGWQVGGGVAQCCNCHPAAVCASSEAMVSSSQAS